MVINPNDIKPIYIQIAEGIEDDILRGIIEEETQVMSTTEFAHVYGINPATTRKAMNILVDKGILYKKRGLGMFVTFGAREKISIWKREEFLNNKLKSIIEEGKSIGISIEDIITCLNKFKT
ncbi:GntR family transcriptional regulator [Clostridium sp. HMP27]|uniref:GntR family transcriptional regulator n=1 Tax=Clostridium sp. HMP27 TaxID=1487921 RepID=UPI00052D9176|nr:GntR family transcriptional regulator [Clostridium sp. HMP27]KGK86997.1 GntR family transcriptional regulator [Clostridium sp. HMP27]